VANDGVDNYGQQWTTIDKTRPSICYYLELLTYCFIVTYLFFVRNHNPRIRGLSL
jgi:hypothetical protein